MFLRILASFSFFCLVIALIYVATLALFDSVTLYHTKGDSWIDNAIPLSIIMLTSLTALLVSVGYFRKFSLTEFGGEHVPVELIEVTVLTEEFMIDGCASIDVVAMLAEVAPSGISVDTTIVLFAPAEVEYQRVQDTLQRLHEAGYNNIGLMSDMPADKPCQHNAA